MSKNHLNRLLLTSIVSMIAIGCKSSRFDNKNEKSNPNASVAPQTQLEFPIQSCSPLPGIAQTPQQGFFNPILTAGVEHATTSSSLPDANFPQSFAIQSPPQGLQKLPGMQQAPQGFSIQSLPQASNMQQPIIPEKIDFDIGKPYVATIGDCVKELIEASYKIYSELLDQGKSTIICGGQSPSYYCLAMMNFSIYNPDIVNIVILPHSKCSAKTTKSIDKLNENIMYCTRLREKDLLIRDNITIIDGVHSGTGILALEDALKFCYNELKSVRKIAINSDMGTAEIPVDKEIILLCATTFSDIFPRLVQSYHPRDFHKKELFITEFIGLDTNPIANMIIELAKIYPNVPVEETEWYILNHNPTDETNKYAQEYAQKLEIENRRKERGYFQPIVLQNPKRYQCPSCKIITGTAAPQQPRDISLFCHQYDCPNSFKIPLEA